MVTGVYGAGTGQIANLTGAEEVIVDNGGASKVWTTTAAIAALSGNGLTTDIINTAITTVGAGTLTAAALLGGVITRTGPVAAYTDTTDTAAAIVTAIGSFNLGATFFATIKNATAFTQTLAAGTGVTLPVTNVVGPYQETQLFGVIGGTAAVPTVTFNHLSSGAISDAIGSTTPTAGSLATVGAGTITAALINGGIVARSGSQTNTAFTDTTDTGTAIVAGNPGLIGKIGASMLFWYQNTTNANATLTGGTGVTVSGITVVPSGTSALYLITQTAANTLTMVGIMASAPVTASGTFVANNATPVTVADTRITASSVVVITLKTVGGTVGASAPAIKTITPGTGFTVTALASDTSTYNYQIIG